MRWKGKIMKWKVYIKKINEIEIEIRTLVMNMTQSQLFDKESWIPAKKNYAMKSHEF